MVGIPEAQPPVWEDTPDRESCSYSFRELTPLLTASRFLGPVSGGPAVSQETGQRQTMLSRWHMPAGLPGRVCEFPVPLGHSPARVRPHILPDFPPAPTSHPPATQCPSQPCQTAEAWGVGRASSVHLQQTLPLPPRHLLIPCWCSHFTVCSGTPTTATLYKPSPRVVLRAGLYSIL